MSQRRYKLKLKEPWNPFVTSSDEESESDEDDGHPLWPPHSQNEAENPFEDNPFDDTDPFSVLFKVCEFG